MVFFYQILKNWCSLQVVLSTLGAFENPERCQSQLFLILKQLLNTPREIEFFQTWKSRHRDPLQRPTYVLYEFIPPVS